MRMKLLPPFFFLMICSNVFANLKQAEILYNQSSKKNIIKIVNELLEDKMALSATPFIKQYLSETEHRDDSEFDSVLDRLITEVGIRQFEVFPEKILEKSKASAVKYILAKKYFRLGKYETSLSVLKSNKDNSRFLRPFELLLEGSIYAVTKKEDAAIRVFKECVDVSDEHIKKENILERKTQLLFNRDYCQVGISRAQFGVGKFEEAYSTYLDLQKSSHIWPEILFEEAWNSFYLKDYNRTLGKLVTYKAPIMTYIFNPEIEVLKALTYMELCLWGDATKIVEGFYLRYEKDYEGFKKFLLQQGSELKNYSILVKEFNDGKIKNGDVLQNLLGSIARDPAYRELYRTYNSAQNEFDKIKAMSNGSFRNILNENLKESLSLQRNLIGSYIRAQLTIGSAQIQRAFEDMSYIKLEMISKKKDALYNDFSDAPIGKRGDIAHLKRNDKQYFWNFNGEFWADELGDYVFSLKSECR